jgi:hypothetical protein
MILKKLHWAVFACGVALLAVGAVGAARGWTSTGLGFIFGVGLVCMLLALVAHRLTGVKIDRGGGHTKIGFELNPTVLQEIKETGLAAAAGVYSFIHNQLAEDPDLNDVKVRLQDQVVQMVKEKAFNEPVKVAEVDEVLESGSAAERVLVFGLLQGDRDLATVARLEKGILHSKSGNEQYHALLAARAHWGAYSAAEQEQLRNYIRDAPFINDDPDRAAVAADLLGRPAKTH